MSNTPIKVAVDVRDLQISASGARSYLQSLVIELKKEHPSFIFYNVGNSTHQNWHVYSNVYSLYRFLYIFKLFLLVFIGLYGQLYSK